MKRKISFIGFLMFWFYGMTPFVFSDENTPLNFALSQNGAKATCSSTSSFTNPFSGTSYAASCEQAIDGVTTKEGINAINNTFWGTSNKKIPAWLKIDLKKETSISKIVIKQASSKLTYTIEISTDDKVYKEVVPSFTQEGPSDQTHTFPAMAAKYIRLTVTDVHYPTVYPDEKDLEENIWAVAIWELEVYEK